MTFTIGPNEIIFGFAIIGVATCVVWLMKLVALFIGLGRDG